jgi:hypothetical protein
MSINFESVSTPILLGFGTVTTIWLQYWRIGDKKSRLAIFLAPIFLEPEQPLRKDVDVKEHERLSNFTCTI